MPFWKSYVNPIWSWLLVTIHFVYLARGRMYNCHHLINWKILAWKSSWFIPNTIFFLCCYQITSQISNITCSCTRKWYRCDTSSKWEQTIYYFNCSCLYFWVCCQNSLGKKWFVAFTMPRYKWWPGNELLSSLVASGRAEGSRRPVI